MAQQLSRKQREIRERDQLILDAALDILRREGFATLSMEKIASAIEYTRGTIYQHYRNKEEILAAICINNMQIMASMFDRALTFKGKTRERMLAVMLAYELYIQLHPENFQDFQIIKNEAIRDKVSVDRQQALNDLESHVVRCIAQVVREAITSGELTLNDVSPEELVFGLWAMAFGAVSLQFSDIPLENLGIHNPLRIARAHARRLLDGYNWPPLSTEWDYDKTAEQILNTVFHTESQQLDLQQENTQ